MEQNNTVQGNTIFEAEIIIGIEGVAVLKLTESPAPGFTFESKAGEPFCAVGLDIVEWGAEDWTYYLPGKPEKPGGYVVKGEAFITNDESQYNKAEWQTLWQ